MFEDLLVEQNPHWSGEFYPEGLTRDCFSKLLSYLPLNLVVSITGVRRGGKSTLVKQLINHLIGEEKVHPKNILFVNLEHPYFIQYAHDVNYLQKLYEDYLKLARPKGKIYCFLDEIQFFADWPIFIKSHYEQKKVKFVITGSNSYLLSHELLTMLSGRTLPLYVFPLSFHEYLHSKLGHRIEDQIASSKYRHEIRALLEDYLHFGGFPEVALHSQTPSVTYDILNAYSKSILYQDVASRLKIKKPIDLEKLFYYLISHVGSPFSYKSLSKAIDLSDKTIKEYLDSIKDSQLLFEFNTFSYSLKHQMSSEKKCYAIDTGMVNAVAFKFSENRGKIFENAVYLQLKRSFQEVYHYQTRSGFNVDFVTKQGTSFQLIQACADLRNEETRQREIRALVEGAKEMRLIEGLIITEDEEFEITVEAVKIKAVPLYKYLILVF